MQKPHLFLLVGLVGCSSDAPSPSEVRAHIASDLVTVVETANAARAGGASLPDTAQLSLLAGTLSHLSSKLPADTFGGMPSMPSMTEDLDGAEAARWLNEHLFTDANHAGDGIYKVPASLACESEGAIDPDCAQAFAQLQLRIRASEDDGVLQLALQIGKNHDEPLAIELSAKAISVSLDLDEAEDALRAFLPKTGTQAPAFQLDGKLTATLEAVAPAVAHVSLEIERALWIRFADAGESLDSPTAFELSSKRATVLDLGLDGTTHAMTLKLALDATHARIPDEIDGPTAVHLPGFTADLAYAEGTPLKIKELALPGTFQIVVGTQEAMGIELNPSDGHALHGQLANGLLEVSPRLDLRTRVDHALLGDDAPVYDVRRILLEGGLRARADESVEVVGGTFSIETNPVSYGFTAVDGQCVRGSEAFDTTRDASYTQYTVGACN